MANLLNVEGLCVEVKGKTLLDDVDLTIPAGEVHALLGPNGSGKTSLVMTIMGYRQYMVKKGRISLGGVNITNMDVTRRSRYGVRVAQQRPPSVNGVRLRQFLDFITAGNPERISEVNAFVREFRMEAFLDREINAELSGGEIRRSELLQVELAGHGDG